MPTQTEIDAANEVLKAAAEQEAAKVAEISAKFSVLDKTSCAQYADARTKLTGVKLYMAGVGYRACSFVNEKIARDEDPKEYQEFKDDLFEKYPFLKEIYV